MKLFYLISVQIKIAFLSQYSQNLKYNLKTLYSLVYYFLKVPLYHKLTRFHQALSAVGFLTLIDDCTMSDPHVLNGFFDDRLLKDARIEFR